jgi:hypothetical protein
VILGDTEADEEGNEHAVDCDDWDGFGWVQIHATTAIKRGDASADSGDTRRRGTSFSMSRRLNRLSWRMRKPTVNEIV